MKGLFRFASLPFGITSAGSLFQSAMDKILSGLQNTSSYLDDILIIARTLEEMTQQFEAVLKRLMEHGVKVNGSRSRFFEKFIEFVGHRCDKNGIHQSEELTEAIMKPP